MSEVAFIWIRRLLCLFLLIYLCHPFVDSRALNGSNEEKKEQSHKNESVSVENVKENNNESKETQGINESSDEIQEREFITLTTEGSGDENEVTQSLPSVNNEANLESNIVTNTPDDNVVIITEGSKTYEIRNGVITEIPTPHHSQTNNEENIATESPKSHDETTRDSRITNNKTETRNLTTNDDTQNKLHANNESTELFTDNSNAKVENPETALGSGDDNDATQISHSLTTNTTDRSNSQELTDTNTSLDEDVIITEGNKTFMIKNGAITEIPPPRASELKVATNNTDISTVNSTINPAGKDTDSNAATRTINNNNSQQNVSVRNDRTELFTEKDKGSQTALGSGDNIDFGSGDENNATPKLASVETNDIDKSNSEQTGVSKASPPTDNVKIITEGDRTFELRNGVITEIPTPRASDSSEKSSDESIVSESRDATSSHDSNTSTNSESSEKITNNQEDDSVSNESTAEISNETEPNDLNTPVENKNHSIETSLGSGESDEETQVSHSTSTDNSEESNSQEMSAENNPSPADDVVIITEGSKTFMIKNGVITEIPTPRASESSKVNNDQTTVTEDPKSHNDSSPTPNNTNDNIELRNTTMNRETKRVFNTSMRISKNTTVSQSSNTDDTKPSTTNEEFSKKDPEIGRLPPLTRDILVTTRNEQHSGNKMDSTTRSVSRDGGGRSVTFPQGLWSRISERGKSSMTIGAEIAGNLHSPPLVTASNRVNISPALLSSDASPRTIHRTSHSAPRAVSNTYTRSSTAAGNNYQNRAGTVSRKAQTPTRRTVTIYNYEAPKGTHSTGGSQQGRGHNEKIVSRIPGTTFVSTYVPSGSNLNTRAVHNLNVHGSTHSTGGSGRRHAANKVSEVLGTTSVSTHTTSKANLNTIYVHNSNLMGSTHSTGGANRRHSTSKNRASRLTVSASASTHNPSSETVNTISVRSSNLMGGTHSTGGTTQKQSSSKSPAVTSGLRVQATRNVFGSTRSTGGFRTVVVSDSEKGSTILNRNSKSTSSYSPFTLVETMRQTIGRGASHLSSQTNKTRSEKSSKNNNSNKPSISSEGQSPVTSNSNFIRTYSSVKTAQSSRPDPSLTSKMGTSFTNTVNAIFSSSMNDLLGGVTRKVVNANSPQRNRLSSDVSSQTVSAAPAEEVNTAASANNNAAVITAAVRNTGTTSSLLTQLFNLVTNSNAESVTGQK